MDRVTMDLQGIILKELTIQDFKTYRGTVVLPFDNTFTAIMGSNGAGKSNILDALAFVLGEKDARKFRVNQYRDLVSTVDPKDRPSEAVVTALFQLEDDSKIKFARRCFRENGTSLYSVNDSNVSEQSYEKQLSNIQIRHDTFGVYQETLDSIIAMGPLELTAMIERISGSIEHEIAYNRVSERVKKAYKTCESLVSEKKLLQTQRLGMLKEQKQRQIYDQLLKENDELELLSYLFKLYTNEEKIKNLQSEENQLQNQLKDLCETKKSETHIYRENLEHTRKLEIELKESYNSMKKVGEKRDDLKTTWECVKKRKRELEEVVKSHRRNLEVLNAKFEKRRKDIREMEESLRDLEKILKTRQEELAKSIEGKQLSESQLQEYRELEESVKHREQENLKNLVLKKRIRETEKHNLKQLSSRILESEEKLSRLKSDYEKCVKKVQELEELMISKEEESKKLEEICEKYRSDEKSYDQELEEIREKMVNLRSNARYCEKQRKLNQNLEILKKKFPGVVGRVNRIFEPEHERFLPGIIAIFGRNLDSIVVNNMETASLCAKYVEENFDHQETILPLDSIRYEPLQEHWRNKQRDVKLLYDVIRFDLACKSVILYLTRNVLIAPTPEIAEQICDTFNQDCVAYDGTYFRRDGIISGGTPDLLERIRLQDVTRELEALQKREITLMTKSSELQLTKMHSVLQVSGSEENELILKDKVRSQLKYAKIDLDGKRKKVKQLEKDLAESQTKLKCLKNEKANLEKSLALKSKEIEDLEKGIKITKDHLFADFLKKVGVDDVSIFENSDLQQSLINNCAEIEAQRTVIRRHLELEYQTGHYEESMKKLREKITRNEESLRDVELEQSKEEVVKEVELKFRKLEDQYNKRKSNLQDHEKKLAKQKKNLDKCRETIAKIKNNLLGIRTKIRSLTLERQNICGACKANDIHLPTSQSDCIPEDSDSFNLQTTIDYTKLLEDMGESRNLERYEQQLQRSIDDVNRRIDATENYEPDEAQRHQLEVVVKKIKDIKAKLVDLYKKLKKHTSEQSSLVKLRSDKFLECFKKMENSIDRIYKDILMDESAQAFLMLENNDEPYLGGIEYSCIVGGKPFQPMQNLSGGEKAVAALALFISIQSFQKSPLIFFDEIDAHLDERNRASVVNYFVQNLKCQVIAISTQVNFCSAANLLIRVCRSRNNQLSSKCFTVPLYQYRI